MLLLTQYIPHYRIPIYNMISNRVNLTVLHSQTNLMRHECYFNEEFTALGSVGPFLYFKTPIRKFCKKYDVVIAESNIRFVDRNILVINPWRRYKWISWGIGQAASYTKRLGDRDFFRLFRLFLQKKSDASILYSDYPIASYIKAGISRKSIFVANNTVSLSSISRPMSDKNTLLFIGTLYKQKKLEELIYAYREAIGKCDLQHPLIIIGDGDEREALEELVLKCDLSHKITFVGNIVDHKILSTYFSKALVCISPGQAGLGVLTSMANSVPFVTRRDAITGGEIFNINSSNGVIYDSSDDLINLICDISDNRSKYVNMGKNARNYYMNYRLPEHMVNSIIDSILYVLRK